MQNNQAKIFQACNISCFSKNMESALEVLSRAATMVQNNATENRLTSKELPTTAWRRDRRSRTGEYHTHHIVGPSTSAGSSASPPMLTPLTQTSLPLPLPLPLTMPVPPKAHSRTSPSSCISSSSSTTSNITIAAHTGSQLSPTNNAQQMLNMTGSGLNIYHQQLSQHHHHNNKQHQDVKEEEDDDSDAPLDMSLTGSLKQRNSPPPPYREPLPGTNYINATSTITLARPSVITQAPPKRETSSDSRNVIMTTTMTRDHDNRSSESIDEHFRRSLGQDYFTLFGKKSPAHHQQMSQPPSSPQLTQRNYQQQQNSTTIQEARCDLTPTPPTPTPPTTQPPAYTATNNSGQIQQHVASSSSSSLSSSSSSPLACTISPKSNAMVLTPAALAAAQMKALPIAIVGATNLATTTSTTAPYCGKEPISVQPSVIGPVNLKNATTTTSNIMPPQCTSPPPATSLLISGSITTTAPTNVDAVEDSRTTISPHINKPLQLISRSFVSMESSPSTSPSRRTPPVAGVNVTLPAIMRIKTEPGLHHHQQSSAQMKNYQNGPTSVSPPVSPSPSLSNSTTQTLQSAKIAKIKTPVTTIMPVLELTTTSRSPPLPPPTQVSITDNNSVKTMVPSVDDHFAKALGETWTKLLESKEFQK